MKIYGLIFAGGSGKRMNLSSKPKQFLEYNGIPIIIYTLQYFENTESVDEIVVVCIKEWISYFKDLLAKYNIKKVKAVVPGGNTGQESIFNGLQEIYSRSINPKEDIVLIHDGVRPLINESTILDNIECVKKYGTAITVSPAIETIINVDADGKVLQTIDRNSCMLARAPQSFYLMEIYQCHLKANKDGLSNIIDSASMMEMNGYKLHTVIGPAENIKITTPSDFYVFKAWIDQRNDKKGDL